MRVVELVDAVGDETKALNALVRKIGSEQFRQPAAGDWTVKDVLAHLVTRELLLLDVLKTFHGEQPGPFIASFTSGNRAAFNASEQEKRKYATAQQIEDEYNDVQVLTTSLLMQLPEQKVTQPGTVTLFGSALSLSDFIVSLTEHVQEHCDQIRRFRKQHQGTGIAVDTEL